jgi:hypothetical protein
MAGIGRRIGWRGGLRSGWHSGCHKKSWITLCLFGLLIHLGPPSVSAAVTEKILEDVPGRLVLELNVSGHTFLSAGANHGMRVACTGCHAAGSADGPDLPFYRFDVLGGAVPPTVSFQILESETRMVAEGIAPVPRAPTPNTTEFHADAGLFAEAASLAARPLGLRQLRGVPVRGVEVPLSLWNAKAKSLTIIKRLRVQLDFAGVLARPSSLRLEERFLRAVKNPVGGAYLYPSPPARSRALAKAGAARDSLGNRFVRIKVGDVNVESFDEDRVYGLSFSDLSRISGLAGEASAIKVRNLRMFTGINDTLPRHMDSGMVSKGTLREIPIEVVDRDKNGTFDGDDSIRFFAHGTSIWKRLPESTSRIRFEFSADPYSFDNFYYLDFSSRDGLDGGLRLAESAASAPAGSPLTDSYAYLRAEKDLETAACDPSSHKDEETGFDWYWYWKGTCKTYSDTAVLTRSNLATQETATLPDLIHTAGTDSLFMGFYIYASRSDSIFTAYYGGAGDTLDLYRKPGSPGSWYVWTKAVKSPPVLELDRLIWRGTEMRFEGYSVCYRRKHVLSGDRTWIFPAETGARVSYQVQGGPGAKCLRIEDGVATRMMALDGQGVFTDSLAPGADAKYLVYRNPGSLPAANLVADGLPASGGALKNLGTGDGKYPEYLIITSRDLMQQALALRDYRNAAGRALRIKTEVAAVEDIYRQFSSGRLSPTGIRDFLRYAYNGWDTPSAFGKLKYVLFFGDGHYDYRQIRAKTMKSAPQNVVPPYEFIVEGGREEIASDDFYAMLDAGDFNFRGGGSMLDVALGRVPVQTPKEALDYLKKIADYENPALGGEWRSRVVMAADDQIQRGSPGDLDQITRGHTTDSDRLGAVITANQKGTTVDRVYLLDYALNSAYHKPEAAQDLLSFINRGSLLVNYVGHGASNQWADEVLLQTNDAISRMRNEGRTPMVNAFSCTVGRFESLTSEGMSEQFVKQRGVGAIGAVSATRETFPQWNIELANGFYARAFPADSSGQIKTAGEALMEAKNSSETTSFENDSKYGILGEPVLLLRKPQLKVSFSQVMDTIKALDCNTIQGKISGGSGAGKVNIKIMAGSVHKSYVLGGNFATQEVDKRGNILFERTFPYKGGTFSTDYFIPKQISFGDTNAQVMVFAWDESVEMEGTTARTGLRIQGTAQSACASDTDGKGPRIRVTGCEKKETGELDFSDRVKLSLPYCLQINVQDSLGGVLSAQGPDEGTTVEIPGVLDPFHPQPGIDELYQKTYQLTLDKRSVSPGTHLLKVSARDGYGNISLRQLQMELTADSSLNTVMARNVPNPMKRNGTTFYFSAITPTRDIEFGDPTAGIDKLEYEVRIFNQGGNLVRTFPKAQSGLTNWDGRDHWGGLLGNGVYFYSVTARQMLLDAGVKPGYRTVSSRRNTLVISR